jgi:hypothetical protein
MPLTAVLLVLSRPRAISISISISILKIDWIGLDWTSANFLDLI